jgi:hypothetical protein
MTADGPMVLDGAAPAEDVLDLRLRHPELDLADADPGWIVDSVADAFATTTAAMSDRTAL